MTKFIRVRDKGTGHAISVNADLVDTDDFVEAYERLDEPAVDPNGNPLPPDYAETPEVVDEKPVEIVTEPGPVPKPPTPAKPATTSKEK